MTARAAAADDAALENRQGSSHAGPTCVGECCRPGNRTIVTLQVPACPSAFNPQVSAESHAGLVPTLPQTAMLGEMPGDQFGHLKHADLLLAVEHGLESFVGIDERPFLGILKFVLLDVVPELLG